MATSAASKDFDTYNYAEYDGCTGSVTIPIGYVDYLANNSHLLRSTTRAGKLLIASLKTMESVLPPVALDDPNYSMYISKLPKTMYPPVVVHVDLGKKFYLQLVGLMEILHRDRLLWNIFEEVYARFVLMLARDVHKADLEKLFESNAVTDYQRDMLRNTREA